MYISESYIYKRFRNQSNKVWESNDSFYESNRYLIENLKSLRFCQECFELKGTIQLSDGHSVKQKCACTRSSSEASWYVVFDGKRWFKDYNREYETCYCCGLEVIPSGSRWSLFYCQDCKAMIRKLNETLGFCLIPYGRHSIMNGVSIDKSNVDNKDAIKDFLLVTQGLFDRMGTCGSYRKSIARQQTAIVKMNENDPVIDLLLRSHNINRRQTKKEAFFQLVSSVTGKPVDDIREILNQTINIR